MKQEINSPKEKESENILSEILNMFLPYWPFFLISLIIGIISAYTYLQYATYKYEAIATIIIKDENKGNDDSKLMESLNLINTKKIIENEIEVLQSRTIMERVVKNLHLYAPIHEDGKIKPKSAYLNSPIFIEVLHPDSIQKVKEIHFLLHENQNSITLASKYNYKMDIWNKTPYGTLKFIANENFKSNEHKNQFYFSLYPPREATQSLLSNLTISASSKLSSIINLKFKDSNPSRAENILNEVIKIYNNSAIEDKNILAVNTISFVEDRLNDVGRELALIEETIQLYKSTNNAIDISTQGTLFLGNVSVNDQKLSDINMQLAVLNQVENFINSKDNSGGIIPSTLGVNDPGLTQLLENLYFAESEYDKLKNTVAENNPMLTSLVDQISRIRPNILINIRTQKESLEASKNNLNKTNEKYNNILQTIPLKERQLLEISREQLIKKEIYSFLLQKREESSMSYASNVSDTKIVDAAQASLNPVSPNGKLIYLAFIIATMSIVAIYIIIREIFTAKILYIKEIQNKILLPIVGEIYNNIDKDVIVINKLKRTFIAEGFRELRTTLYHMGIDGNHKKILVTSSITGEGKSFIASNLAVSLALSYKKVVLVNMDLYNPSLEKIMKFNQEIGLTQYLEGECTVESLISMSDIDENLFFIPIGQLSNNPSELLLNGKVEELLKYLENNFDFIIIDTSPLVPVSDAITLSAYCDATLFVIRHDYTPKLLLKRFNEKSINKLTNPAIIFNGVKERGYIKNYYGYGYGYSHNYIQK